MFCCRAACRGAESSVAGILRAVLEGLTFKYGVTGSDQRLSGWLCLQSAFLVSLSVTALKINLVLLVVCRLALVEYTVSSSPS